MNKRFVLFLQEREREELVQLEECLRNRPIGIPHADLSEGYKFNPSDITITIPSIRVIPGVVVI